VAIGGTTLASFGGSLSDFGKSSVADPGSTPTAFAH
jgi:hypothetical protein